MTFFDFWQCAKRYFYIVIGLPILFMAIAALWTTSSYGIIGDTSIANVSIYSNTGTSLLNGLTELEAKNAMQQDSSVQIVVDYDSLLAQISIEVSGKNEEKNIEVANKIAESAIAKTKSMFSEDSNAYSNYTGLPFEATTSDVTLKKDGKEFEKKIILSLLVGFCGGLVLAICIIVLLYAVRRPVLTKSEIEETFNLPVLVKLNSNDGSERLLANIRFAIKKHDVGAVCFVPVSDKSLCTRAANALYEAAKTEGISSQLEIVTTDKQLYINETQREGNLLIYECSSLNASMNAAYISQKCDATLIVVRKWRDSIIKLKNVVEELLLADSRLVGFVFIEK